MVGPRHEHLAGCQAPELCHSCGQGCAPDRLATTSEGHLATVPICTETPSTLTHPAANTCAGLLAALPCATSGSQLVEPPASMVHAAPLLTHQLFLSGSHLLWHLVLLYQVSDITDIAQILHIDLNWHYFHS